uniref:UDP-glycosyltransferases domain-containing protein n=1 Tax=Alexandrium monilatum TaxID=311494 RepID=A0A7S4T7R3_9DINO
MAATLSTLPHLLQSKSVAGKNVVRKEVQARADEPPVIALFNVAMVGHVNPTLSIVKQLVEQGCKVHYFLPPGEDARAAARESGATVEAYLVDDPQGFALEQCGDFSDCLVAQDRYAVWGLASTLHTGEYVLQRCQDLRVKLVVYDPMTPHGILVAKKLGVPGISVVTYPGVGCLAGLMGDEEKLARWAKLRRPIARQILERFDVDLNSELSSRGQWFSEDENLVTTSEALVAPLPEPGSVPWADEARERFPWVSVGCTASEAAPHITGPSKASGAATGTVGDSFPAEELRDAAARGARVVFAALGSMAVGLRWAEDLTGSSSGVLPEGTTGKAFCQHVWAVLFDVMRELGDGYHCVLCVGRQADALDFLPGEDDEQRLRHVPANVTVRAAVQQVAMLKGHADVFVTHAGFNSLQESLIAGVPLIALPQAVDQPDNARKIEASGWGRGFLRPMGVGPSELAAVVRELAREDSSCRAAVAAAGAGLCGGEVRAAERLLAWVR